MKKFTIERFCCWKTQSITIQGIIKIFESRIETPFVDGQYIHRGYGIFSPLRSLKLKNIKYDIRNSFT